ncbi:MAG TPA: DUF6048 family protein [Bacteroidales bacterium]|nr:hypothetical protein [Bacteroidales bacterium]HNR42298.1 DUF6048 family protein [Bacteroidales bacterium]HPM19334.1 DUF6048 family protein [Bacteroidales bacterium]HQG76371.1 DUF6048 family protein [Bacteroidales bacterium]
MRRTCVFFISLLLFFHSVSARAQDTIEFPLKIRIGMDVAGPAISYYNRDRLSLEGVLSLDRNEKMAYVLEGGYLKFNYSQYNYDYRTEGVFMRAGVNFNLLKPETSTGKYWAGVGLRYGLSLFSTEVPFFRKENYWGTYNSSLPGRTSAGHFIEVSPGVRTELFKNLSIGWSVRLRLLISGGGGRDLRPIHFPGFGNSGKITNAGINYYIVWEIPFKTKKVIRIPETEEEEEEETPVEGLPGNEVPQNAFPY